MWGDGMNDQAEQENAKKDITALISEETQIAMMNFFLHTSVPRILKRQELEAQSIEPAQRE